jgi:membrane protein implicated in regulation of membrane protease activity
MYLLLKSIQFLLGAFALYTFGSMMYWREYYTRHLRKQSNRNRAELSLFS